MDEHAYYTTVLGYFVSENYYEYHARLWQGVPLFRDLEKLFGSKPAKKFPEVDSTFQLYSEMVEANKRDSGYLLPIVLLKRRNAPEAKVLASSENPFLLLQKESIICLKDSIVAMELLVATPGRGSGYIECRLKLENGTQSLLPTFSEALSNTHGEDKAFMAVRQTKVLADFLRIPWKLEVFVDA